MPLSTDELTLAQSTVASITALLAAYDAAAPGADRDAILGQLREVLSPDVRNLAYRLYREQAAALREEIDAALTPYFTDANRKADAVTATDALRDISHASSFVYGALEPTAAKAVLRFFQTAIEHQ